MAQTSHIKRRGAIYYAQLAVPLDVQPVLKRKTLDQSLRTADPNVAKLVALDVLKQWRELFEKIRRREVGVRPDVSPLTAAQIAARDYRARLAVDHERRNASPVYATIGLDDQRIHELREAVSGRMPTERLIQTVAPQLKHFQAAGLIAPNLDAAGWIEIAKALAVSEFEAMARMAERDEGDFSGKPGHPILANAPPPEAEPVKKAAKGERIVDLFDRYARENSKNVSADTLTQARRDVKLFAETFPKATPDKLDGELIGEWKDMLLQLPVKFSETATFKGMSVRQVIEVNKRVGKPTITDRTVNRYLSALGAFCDWLVRRTFLKQNPVAGMHQTVDKDQRTTRTFSADQMHTLFRSPLFAGARNEDDWQQDGDFLIRDHRYWVPLIMLYSGARPAEIAQLAVGDVRQEHGVWIMHITTEGEGEKSVKTKGSMRVLPVHPELIRLGFISYRDMIAAGGEARLFPKAERNQRGQMIADFSRDFGRFLTKLKIKSGRGLSLYSFRHGFADALRRAGFLDSEFGILMGHTSHSMTGRYGHLPQGTLLQRKAMIEAVVYPELDLTHLLPANP